MLLRRVVERVKSTDFLQSAQPVERVEVTGVKLGQFGSFQVATAQVRISVGEGIVPGEEVET